VEVDGDEVPMEAVKDAVGKVDTGKLLGLGVAASEAAAKAAK
jgi:hypothetical protein